MNHSSNRVGAPNQGAEVWDLGEQPKDMGKIKKRLRT